VLISAPHFAFSRLVGQDTLGSMKYKFKREAEAYNCLTNQISIYLYAMLYHFNGFM
jgi:hypothetical protein